MAWVAKGGAGDARGALYRSSGGVEAPAVEVNNGAASVSSGGNEREREIDGAEVETEEDWAVRIRASKEGRKGEGRGVGIAPKETPRAIGAPLTEGRRRGWRVGPRRQRNREDRFVRPGGFGQSGPLGRHPQRPASTRRFVRPIHFSSSRTVRTTQTFQAVRFSPVQPSLH